MAIYEADFGVTGAERKKLIQALQEVTMQEPEYCGAPTFAYKLGNLTVDRNGKVTADIPAEKEEELRVYLNSLQGMGYKAELTKRTDEPTETPADPEPEEAIEEEPVAESETTDEDESRCGLKVTIPLEAMNLSLVKKILELKGDLIQKALGADTLEVTTDAENAHFDWFEGGLTPDEAGAYMRFIAALCQHTTKIKRVNKSNTEVTNERFHFRCFLLRLGYIGDDTKRDREILTRNLEGNSAFRDGRKDKSDETTD